MALGGQATLELSDDPVHRRQVLDRASGKRPLQLVQGTLGRKARGALDEVALQLAAQMLLEAAKLLPRDPMAPGVVVLKLRLRLGAQSEGPPDPLDVDPQDA
jgi:hypothetical protein